MDDLFFVRSFRPEMSPLWALSHGLILLPVPPPYGDLLFPARPETVALRGLFRFPPEKLTVPDTERDCLKA